MKNVRNRVVSSLLALGMVAGLSQPTYAVERKEIVNLRIAGLSDIHASLVNHDYFQDIEVDNYGLTKVATLIKEAKDEVNKSDKEEVDNFLLVDAGDTIQGNPLGDYYATIEQLEDGHPVYKMMEHLKFDVSALGNHEFNYGLDFITDIVSETNGMALISSNVYDMDGNPIFKQYEVIDEIVVDEDGNEHKIRIGFAGFVPPQIQQWDKQNLEGKVQVKDIVESANEMVDVLRNQEGCDIVIGLAHSGYGHGDEAKYSENMSYQLTQVEGIDALVAGHSHQKFPHKEERINSLPNVDLEKGTINGIPTFMAGNNASDLGIIDLQLAKEGDKWVVLDGTSHIRNTSGIENDEDAFNFAEEYHNKTLDYINQPIGTINKDLYSFFTLVRDSASQEIVNHAQIDYVKKAIENGIPELQEYKDLPLLSINAPFKAGISADNYIDIKKGNIAIKDVSNLYKYSNTLVATKLTGEDVKNILELTATIYNTIDVNSAEEQELINPDFVRFNFNLFEGIEYEIDITQEPRYTTTGEVIDMNNTRIVNVTRNGEPIKDDEEFLVVTNSYLSGGSLFKSFTPEKIVYSSGEETRQVVANYLKEVGNIEITEDFNWRIKPIEEDVNIVFTSSSKGANYLNLKENSGIEEIEKLEDGLSKYRLHTKEIGKGGQEDMSVPRVILLIVFIGLLAAWVRAMFKNTKESKINIDTDE